MAAQRKPGANADAERPEYAGHYRLESRISSDDIGVVHLAQTASGMKVAVKVVHADLAGDPVFRRHLRQGIAAARRVSGDFTVPLIDADPDADRPWLARPFISGRTLFDDVERRGPLPTARLGLLMAELAEALRDIHRAGVVHRDLNPRNVLITGDELRVIDFGIIRPVDSGLRSDAGELMGRTPFMAPEQFRRPRAVGPASDVFALACVIVHAATGSGPFTSDSPYVTAYQVVHDEPDLIGVPEDLAPLLRLCLAKEPEERPTPELLLQKLRDAASPRGHLWLPQHFMPARCRADVTLLDENPRAGLPVRITVRLVAETSHPWARPEARPSLDIVAVPLSGAEIEPATVRYGPEHTDTAQFRITAPEPGTHRIRFTFMHHDTGTALQQVETDLEVADAAPTRAWTRRWWPLPGRS